MALSHSLLAVSDYEEMYKQIFGTMPPRITQKLDVPLVIDDIFTGKITVLVSNIEEEIQIEFHSFEKGAKPYLETIALDKIKTLINKEG